MRISKLRIHSIFEKRGSHGNTFLQNFVSPANDVLLPNEYGPSMAHYICSENMKTFLSKNI